jgi:hypothetical protein
LEIVTVWRRKHDVAAIDKNLAIKVSGGGCVINHRAIRPRLQRAGQNLRKVREREGKRPSFTTPAD